MPTRQSGERRAAADAPRDASRIVVVLLAAAETQQALFEWVSEQGFDLAADYDGNARDPRSFDFHVTIVASRNDVAVPLGEHAIRPVTCFAAGFDALGEDRDVPVLALRGSAVLDVVRDFFLTAYGVEPTYAEFRPHVSISYAWDGSEPDLATLAVPDLPLVFDRIRIASLGD